MRRLWGRNFPCVNRGSVGLNWVILETIAPTNCSAQSCAVTIYLPTLRRRLAKYRLRFYLHNSRVSAGNKHWHLITCVRGAVRVFHARCLCLLAVGLCLLMFSKQTEPSWGDRAVIIMCGLELNLAVGSGTSFTTPQGFRSQTLHVYYCYYY